MQMENLTRSQLFLRENAKVLRSSPEHFNHDSTLQTYADYESAKVRVLVIFPTEASRKAVSMTASVINDYVISCCPGVFVDFAYLPEKQDFKMYEKHRMPLALGTITGLDPSHYDIVGFSISILFETVTTAWIMNSLRYCDRPIPLSWTERKDLKLSETPILHLGGITSSVADILFGEFGDGRQAFVDFIHLGEIHCAKSWWDHFSESKAKGRTVQETINTFWQERPDQLWLYQPQAYRVTYNDKNQITENVKINPYAPDLCEPYYYDEAPDILGSARGIVMGNGLNAGTAQIFAANGCSRSGMCNFCHEGSYTGGWVEATPQQLHHFAVESRRYTAANKLHPYAFNINYLSDFRGAIHDWMKVYPKVHFSNQRLEEQGRDPEALRMMLLSGVRHLIAPLEGVSERIRNGLINKNLTNEALNKFLEFGIRNSAMDCKVGMIFTGFEEDQDWQEFWEFNQYWKRRAAEIGSKFYLRYKFTFAVYYPDTPWYYLERKATRHSFNGTMPMPAKWNDLYYSNGISIQVNGFKYSTLLEQLIVDLGRSITPWLYNDVIRAGIQANTFRTIALSEKCLNALKAYVNQEHYFEEKDVDNTITPTHRIHIKLHAAVIHQARHILKDKLNASPVTRCLKTYEGCPVECKANVFAKAPLRLFGDCHLDQNGVLRGQEVEVLKGCRRCATPEERVTKMLRRKIGNTKTGDDILMHKSPGVECKIRFVVERLKSHEVLSPYTTVHTTLSKFLQHSDDLLSMYWELVEESSAYWQATTEIPYISSGVQVFDAKFTSPKAFEIVKGLVDEVNASCKTVRVLSVQSVMLDDTIKKTDYNLFHFTSSLPAELWQYLCMNYEGEVRVEEELGMKIVKDPELVAPKFTLRDGVEGYFAIPTRYNPWCYLSGLFSRKRVSINRLLESTSVDCISVFRKSNVPCLCGKESALYDIANRKLMSVGSSCAVSYLVKIFNSK